MNPVVPFTVATACAIMSLATGDVGLLLVGLIFAAVGIVTE